MYITYTIHPILPCLPDSHLVPDVMLPLPQRRQLPLQQAPNRATTWSVSQRNRDELVKTDPRFVGKDLSMQPQPLAAIELIKKQPVSFVHGNIAVCHGTDFVQGHPKVYINLDKDKVATCGYCGARYARKDLEGKL